MKLTALFELRYLPYARKHLKARTVAEYERLARAVILPRLGTRDIEKLNRTELEAWHAKVPGDVQANRALACLSAMLTYAVERALLKANPAHGVERNPERGCEFFYDPAQCQAIIAAASAFPDIRGQYIALELLTGCRPGELLDSALPWRHGSVLRTPDGKTGARTIYLPPRACAILDVLKPRYERPDGTKGYYFPVEGMDLRRAWDRICRTAGVPRARRYDLRHTFASAALAAGESLAVIGLVLGHKKDQTTRRYAHLAPDVGLAAAARAAERMGV